MKRKIGLFIGLVFWVFGSIQAQSDCEVLAENLKGTYTGDCKKGMAHGKGVAKGVDSYNGEFKKGLCHGEGTYTFADGRKYVGEFTNGLADGKGIMTKEGVVVNEGYWEEGDFIGALPYSSKSLSSSPDVTGVTFRRKDNGDKIEVVVIGRGKKKANPKLSVTVKAGSMLRTQTSFSSFDIIGVKFPFEATITTQDGNYANVVFNRPGNWEVTISGNIN